MHDCHIIAKYITKDKREKEKRLSEVNYNEFSSIVRIKSWKKKILTKKQNAKIKKKV